MAEEDGEDIDGAGDDEEVKKVRKGRKGRKGRKVVYDNSPHLATLMA